jgi:LemA protein
MKKITGLVVLAVVAIVLFMGCNGYNKLKDQDVVTNKAWDNLQTSYQKRSNLTVQLLETVKGAAGFEKTTLTDVINARNSANAININGADLTPEKMAEFQKMHNQVTTSAKSSFNVLVESYPQLRATENFSKFQNQLESIQNGVQNDQKLFNEAIANYESARRNFPMMIFSSLFKFGPREGIKATEAETKNPEVKF